MRCVLSASVGWRDLWHRHGDGGQDADRYLLWQHNCLVSVHVYFVILIVSGHLFHTNIVFNVMTLPKQLSKYINCTLKKDELILNVYSNTKCFIRAVFPVCSNEAGQGFELRVELYSCCSEEDYSAGSASRKLASKLSSSLGRSAGKKTRAALEPGACSPTSNGGGATILLPVPSVP